MNCIKKWNHMTTFVIFCLTLFFLSGCGTGKQNVLFVTKTSLGIDIDSKPPAIDIGYSRKEATLSPKFEGGVLPQMATFSTDVGFVNTAVGQSFATGNAALLMSKYIGTKMRPASSSAQNILDAEILDDNKTSWVNGSTVNAKRYFFGTDTSFALKITFGLETGGYPDSFSLGYKRKELAYVPLMEGTVNGQQKVGLPSLIATADLDTETPDVPGTQVQYKQFYATGRAASYLAALPEIRNTLGYKILDVSQLIAAKASRERFESQSQVGKEIIKKFSETDTIDKQVKIFDQAIALGIISEDQKDKSDEGKKGLFRSLIVMYVNENHPDGLDKLVNLNNSIEVIQ
ncbi:MAG: hypothetical protein JRE64_12495 [Deltaproteobacteria bacterium]|nr:hypothetical protein [Deltaproteobacteria bacterium]